MRETACPAEVLTDVIVRGRTLGELERRRGSAEARTGNGAEGVGRHRGLGTGTCTEGIGASYVRAAEVNILFDEGKPLC